MFLPPKVPAGQDFHLRVPDSGTLQYRALAVSHPGPPGPQQGVNQKQLIVIHKQRAFIVIPGIVDRPI